MPEENFEQQARSMSEHFSMEPKDIVWQRVQAAITPPKRKRRVLLWWWLLPVCVAGGLAVFFTYHKKTVLVNKPLSASVNGNKPFTKNKKTDTLPDKIKSKKRQENVVSFNSNTVWQKQNIGETETERSSDNLFEKHKQEHKFIKQPHEVVMNIYPQINTGDEEVLSANSSQQKEKIIINHDSVFEAAPVLLPNTTILPVILEKSDTTAIIILKDSLLHNRDTSVAVINKKRTDKNHWQVGIMVEAGIASRGKSLFNNEANLNNPSRTPPQDNTAGSGAAAGVASVYQNIKSGADVAVGMAAHKTISSNIYISSQLAYRYQQYVVRSFLADSLTNGGTFNTGRGTLVGDENYQLHFLTISAGVGWQFFTRKKTTLSLEVGVDNSWLLATKQRIKNQTSQFSTIIFTSFTVTDFYRWQPQATISVPVAFNTRHIHLQLVPFTRFGFRTFQKDNGSYQDNHLASAGMQAIYFFK